jgi:hypothetical protein
MRGVQPVSEGARMLGMMLQNGTAELSTLQNAARDGNMTDARFEAALEKAYVSWNLASQKFYRQSKNTLDVLSTALDKNDGLMSGMIDIITPISNISGTKARQALKSGNKSEVITYFPPNISDQDIEKIIDIARTSLIKENIQKTGYRAGEFNPDYPAETLKDKGIGLTSSKVGLLGTGHYFFGSKKKAEKTIQVRERLEDFLQMCSDLDMNVKAYYDSHFV